MVGKTVSHYKILERLGAGGMGVVYKAEDTRLKRTVALKFLPPEFTHDQAARERFFHEAQAASALEHANICSVHELGEHEGRTFLVMGFYEGETLKQKIDRGPMPIEAVLDIAMQTARGLSRAHEAGIVHRDVKPANLIVTARGEVKILDFGLAKLAGRTMLTRSGSTLGTAAYMSPEQARGETVDHRTDIWSLGVVLYEMIAGRRPFWSDYEQAAIYQIINTEPEPLTNLRPETPTGLAQIVGHALAKQPEERYQTMELFLEDLAAVSEGLRPVTAKPRAVAVKLAVLPFANLTGDPDQEYLSDGLTQEMITLLGRLHPQSLGVIARTSVMRYKKTDTPIDQIGRELGVEYVLEGSARREGSRVRIAADLIQVRDQTQLWGDVLEREMSGILALQNDVAREVAKALALKLLPSELARLATARPVNPEAYEAYLNGLSHWCKLTPADLDSAQKYFESALKKDPNYALAYTGMFLALAAPVQMGLAPPGERMPKAKAYLLKALELDSSLAESHFAMAVLKTWVEWDWEGGEASFRRALEINPNYAMARVYYSNLLVCLDRPEEALAQGEQALQLDPLNSLFMGIYGNMLAYLGRYDEAIAQGQEALRTSPNDPIAHDFLWDALHLKGQYDEALEEAKALYAGMELTPVLEAISSGYQTGGYAGAMRAAADTLAAISQQTYIGPWYIAYPYAAAGEKEKTLEWLEKGYEIGDPNMPYLGGEHSILRDLLIDDPRFKDLLRRMNLPAGDKK
jgi:TolB-like protein/Tfp pilus assembly protein PilF